VPGIVTPPIESPSAPSGLRYLPPAFPTEEKARNEEVHGLDLLDTAPEERFDRIVRVACRIFGVPIAYVSLIADDRQFFKANIGMEGVCTSRGISMCGHAILQDKTLVVCDARKDHRFANNPLVIGEPFVRFYAGQPLRGPHGHKVGTLCILDRQPRAFEESECELLREISALVERELALGDLIQTQAEAIRAQNALAETQRALTATFGELRNAKHQAEELLHSILPKELATELRESGFVQPVRHEEVAVLFADFAGFTKVSAVMEPGDLVEELNECFCHFDWVMARHGVEKLKTIGDGYLAVAGIPESHPTDSLQMLRAAIEIRDYMADRKATRAVKGQPHWDVRIGLHLGPLVAGVVGVRKMAYDVWGDTVNTASRIESAGEPGRINVSATFYQRIRDHVVAVSRGAIDCKNKGEIEMFFVDALKSSVAET
jgi:adenylate cyclase